MTSAIPPGTSQRFGQLASLLPDCASTQDIVRATARLNAPEGFLAVTDFQVAGRGRRGRTWDAVVGTSLLFSLLLRPRTPVERLSALSLAAGIAVAESMPIQARVRWPNDVVIDGAKVAGLIAELETPADAPPFVILGVGINVNQRPRELPHDARLPATSLAIESGSTHDRLSLLLEVVDRIQAAYREFDQLGFGGLLDRWQAVDDLAGREVSVRVGDETVTGVARGVDVDGRLIVQDDQGEVHPLDAGEVERVENA